VIKHEEVTLQRNPYLHHAYDWPTPQVKDPSKFGGKKGKVAAKAGPANTQWDILAQSDIPLSEIPEFRCVRVQLGVVAAVFQLQNTL
jgi:hypothetical protein